MSEPPWAPGIRDVAPTARRAGTARAAIDTTGQRQFLRLTTMIGSRFAHRDTPRGSPCTQNACGFINVL